jgi:hypothetical protein
VLLTFPGVTRASGATLQEAGDELVRKLLVISMVFRSGQVAPAGRGAPLDPGVHEFISELAEYAARGGDIRDRLFRTR